MLTLALATGCSFIAVRGPRQLSGGADKPSCTSSRVLPWLDTTVGGAAGLVGLAFLLVPNEDHTPETPIVLGGAYLLFSLPFVLSAAYGHSSVRECRFSLAEWSSRNGGDGH